MSSAGVLSVEEFEQLESTRTQAKGKSNSELLRFVQDAPKSTKLVAGFLGVGGVAANSRLNRLLEKGLIQRRFKTNVGYWFITDAGKAALQSGELDKSTQPAQ